MGNPVFVDEIVINTSDNCAVIMGNICTQYATDALWAGLIIGAVCGAVGTLIGLWYYGRIQGDQS